MYLIGFYNNITKFVQLLHKNLLKKTVEIVSKKLKIVAKLIQIYNPSLDNVFKN